MTALSHGDSCQCVRCTGFQPGHSLSVKHGAYAVLKLAPRAQELAAELRPAVPMASPADSAAIDVLALVLAQLERAHLVLAAVQSRELQALQNGGKLAAEDRDDLRRLAMDARGWANTARRYLETLGLTPSARAALGLDVARTRDTLTEYLAEHYGADRVEDGER